MVVKMVNMISNQGNYWVSNNFIWSILLIPILSLAEIIKRDCQNEYKKLYQSNYYFISIITFIIWLILSPSYIYFYKDVENLENYQSIFLITIKLIPFYLAYNFSIIPDSIFIGYGKTKYNFINSLIINLIYYGIWFILYKLDLIIFSMDKIIIMFGLGMVIHSLISLIEEKIFFKKEMKYLNLSIKEKLIYNL